jgi:hypothetical protein
MATLKRRDVLVCKSLSDEIEAQFFYSASAQAFTNNSVQQIFGAINAGCKDRYRIVDGIMQTAVGLPTKVSKEKLGVIQIAGVEGED